MTRLASLLLPACIAGAMACGASEGGGAPRTTGATDAGLDAIDSRPAGEAGAPDVVAQDAMTTVDGDSAVEASSPGVDADHDGIDDALEMTWAAAYLPYLSIDPGDHCKTHGLLVRVSPHPHEAGRTMIWYDVLYDADCGANGHVGDDEVFGVVIHAATPAPAGILAVRAISHQGTACQQVTTCGRCAGMSACGTATRAGADYPVVYPSLDKHGNYADEPTCAKSIICDFGGCALSPSPDQPPIVNAGEPGHPLVDDLTSQGFVTSANGWTNAALMHFDPWKAGNFGGAGDISKDLVDESFVADTTGCP